MSGIAVNTLGHADPEWTQVLSSHIQNIVHVSNYYHTPPEKDLAERLTQLSFADQVFLSNSGTEANEAGVKFARKYAKSQTHGEQKTEFITFSRGFHGRTMGTLSLTPKPDYQTPFTPLISGIKVCEYNNAEEFCSLINQNTAGVILEPIQGEGGVHGAKQEFLRIVREECNRYNAVLIFDEVQCGIGRTGSLWGHEHFGIQPDIMTLAKGLGAGIPIGATLVSQKIGEKMNPGDHGNTFGGNALACASALHVLSKVSEQCFLESVNEHAQYFYKTLQPLADQYHLTLRQYGLMIALDIPWNASQIIDECRDQGLLIISAGKNTLRILPPLIIQKEHIDSGIQILKTVFQNQGVQK